MKRRKVGTIRHEVRDLFGVLQGTKVRRNKADGTKKLSWDPPLHGRAVETMPLYRSELVQGWPLDLSIVVTEGEAAAQARLDAGFKALGTVTGAGTTPDLTALTPCVGRDVVLWPDNDTAGPILDELAVRLALEDVADPEIPAVSIVDLGMVGSVLTSLDRIAVDLLPTYLGCHATDAIRASVTERLAAFGRPVEVRFDLATTWSTDRISPAGRERLRRSGFAPAADPDALRCPYCGSDRVVTDSLFGPTLCRSLHYCRGCRQPFEAFKPV